MGDFVKGVVVKVTSKDTRGDSKVYNCLVETDDNGEEWFGCGFKDPNLNEGDEIEFDIDDSTGYTNIDFDTLVVTYEAPKRKSSNRGSSRGSSSGGRSSGRSSGKSSGRSSNGGGGSKRGGSSRNSSSQGSSRGKKGSGKSQKAEVDWDRKDNLIRLQSSQNTAVATIAMMVSCGAVVVPKKKADALDAIQALIELEAARLFSKYTDIVDGCYDAGGEGNAEEYDDDDDVPE